MAALNAADYGQSDYKITCPACAHAFKVTLPVSHTTKAADEIYRLMVRIPAIVIAQSGGS
jgi:hypothetical protein